MFPPNTPRPRLRAGLSRPITVTRKRMPAGLIGTPTPPIARRIPLHPVPTPAGNPVPGAAAAATTGRKPPASSADPEQKLYFSVLYTKRSKKKHKSWLDGCIIVTNDRHVQLLDENGKSVASERYKPLNGLRSGNTLEVGSWELEVQQEVPEESYLSGRLFAPPPPVKASALSRPRQKPFKPLRSTNSAHLGAGAGQPAGERAPVPIYDPYAENAVVLLPALKQHDAQPTVPVVLDPFLAKRMRPHQLDGVKFLFDCTAGRALKGEEGWEGAILADEMGLGKSLQAIALIWTLLKQGPLGKPLAKKAIIVCPASLVRNWENEVGKWLGNERLKPVALESGVASYESKAAMAAFIGGNLKKLLIVSYEMFRSNAAEIYDSNCGLVVCDEGHRLKSAGGNKTVDALRKLPCRRRVILTGTPVQNDLEEFFAVCDFVNPGCLQALNSFRTVFANPIIASRDSNAPLRDKRLGEARAKELSSITSKFVLRRTSNILEKYLPPKFETAIFCRLQPKQEEEYRREARRRYVDVVGGQGMSVALKAINYLRKICSHPCLVSSGGSNGGGSGDGGEKEDEGLTTDDWLEYDNDGDDLPVKDVNVKDSAKMQVTASICKESLLRRDRVIIVSNFTTVLNLMETMLSGLNIQFCRLDGKTAVNQRGTIVRRFNEGSMGDVFLLSAKAGGVGLNLIGANRLILFDPDWNPATDVQAMARVWRDGQKKHVYVYRLLCTGTIEEKIYQRQLFKGELQDAVDGDRSRGGSGSGSGNGGGVGGGGEGNGIFGRDGNFKADELRDVFKYNAELKYCDTLRVLERSQEEEEQDSDNYDYDNYKLKEHRRRSKMGLLNEFKRYRDVAEREGVTNAVWCEDDEVLDQALNGDIDTHGVVSYLFCKTYGAVFSDGSGGGGGGADEANPKPRKRKLCKYLSDSDDERPSGGAKCDDSSDDSVLSDCVAEKIMKRRLSGKAARDKETDVHRFGGRQTTTAASCQQTQQKTVDLTQDDEEDDHRADPTAAVIQVDSSPGTEPETLNRSDLDNGGDVEEEREVKSADREADSGGGGGRGGGEVLDLTWDEALDGLEEDV